ncbi:hypothetical protein V8G54_036515 [Vigna mungo]|uniref:Uncharacterized protein n=1 Tax=Vigna mungo TaxID=3915 RepID=A0AAQ3REI9_VIGMU
MSKGVIDDGFLNSISKSALNFVINSFHEPIKTGISRSPNQEEKRYINILKPAAETVESLDDEETDLMAKRFSKFLLCKRQTNLNLAGNKQYSRKQVSTGATPYIPKIDFERHMVEQMQTLVNHHSTYTSRLDKMDQEITVLHKLIGIQNLGDERVATDDEVEEKDDGDDHSEEKEKEQEETDMCLMARSSSVSSDESECTEKGIINYLMFFKNCMMKL